MPIYRENGSNAPYVIEYQFSIINLHYQMN